MAAIGVNVVVLYLAMGNSQAMRTAWVEDLLALIPPAGFLIASRIEKRPPTQEHPYGYFRSMTIAFLLAAFALVAFGGYMLVEAVLSLVRGEHPTVGAVTLFGEQIWLGWFMVGALVYTAIPPAILGLIKLRIARDLHDKVLYADADMNKADWMTSLSGLVGVLGIGFGVWWLDAVAAMVISLDIVKDGIRNLLWVVEDITDATPRRVGDNKREALPERVREELERLDWVDWAEVRLREEGHVLSGEGYVVVRRGNTPRDLTAAIEDASRRVGKLDWRLYDFTIQPVRKLGHAAPGGQDDKDAAP